MSTYNPKISVILPFYNSERTLESAIKSIQDQSFPYFECILIDNNSTDDSVEIANGFTASDSRFRLFSEKTQGVVFASNKGWVESKGEYIARMDSDDWSHPDRLKLQSDFLDKNPEYGAIGSLVKHVGNIEESGGMARFVDWNNSLVTYEEILNNRFIELPIINPTAMWRRDVAITFGMYNQGDFPEDYEMWLRWLDADVRVGKINKALLHWHDSETRLTRTDSLYSDGSFYRIKTKYLAKWLSKNNPYHPKVAIWGASKISRRRAKLLESHGVEISCYIDTKKNKRHINKPVYYYEDILSAGKIFVLTYIKQMNARIEIKKHLNSKGFTEGKNFLLVS